MDYYNIIGSITVWIILLPLIIGVAVFKQVRIDSKLIFTIVLIGTIPQMIHFFFTASKAEFLSYNLYSPIEFIIYYLLFKNKIHSKNIRLFVKFTSLLCIGWSLYFIATNNIESGFINQWAVLNNISYLVWIILYLYEAFKFDKEELVYSDSFFWYTIGILIYAACTTIVYSLWPRILNSSNGSALRYLRSVQNVFNIIMYLLFSIGLVVDYMNSKKQKTKNL